MNRSITTYIFTALLLLMNVQAAMSDSGNIFHQDSDIEAVQVTSTDAQLHDHDSDEDSHCQHCCHTHASNVFAYESLNHQHFLNEIYFYYRVGKSNPASGPPTPPPNA